jgi:hypothetical protein
MGKYYSKVASLVMHSFSIWLVITLESIFSIQFLTLIARNLRSPNSTTSYSTMLLLHLSVSAVNCKHVAYLSLMLEGDIRIDVALSLSQYICHGVSVTVPSG